MLDPRTPSSYPEIDGISTAKEVGEIQTGSRTSDDPILNFLQDGERTYFTRSADLSLMTPSSSSSEIAAALSAPPGAVKTDYPSRIGRNGQATSIKAPPNNSRVEPGHAMPATASARRRPRPLALVPRPTRARTDFLRPSARVLLMGFRIDCITERQVIRHVISSIREGRGGWIVTPNVDHLRIISQRPDLLALLSEATLRVADGMPLMWASRLQGTPLPERVTGAGLILSLTAAAAKAGASIFLLGGDPGDGEAAAAVLKRLNPELKVAGILCPPPGFENDPLQMTEIGNALHAAKPDMVYSCFGFPKQEFVIDAVRHRLPSTWFLGLGGSLSMVSGRTRRAPSWMQGIGMEWLWRLGLEPRRLFHRYIVNDLPFAIRLLAAALVER
jgi:N-acetylglucosaminyldiphosphoundecaprenol N-acetyl-beta-D-mannosaminyltransferase